MSILCVLLVTRGSEGLMFRILSDCLEVSVDIERETIRIY